MSSSLRKALKDLTVAVVEVKALVQPVLPHLLTIKMTAQELSVSPTTVNRLVAAGQLWTVPLSGRRMVPASEVRRLSSIQAEISGRRRRPQPTAVELSVQDEVEKAKAMLRGRRTAKARA